MSGTGWLPSYWKNLSTKNPDVQNYQHSLFTQEFVLQIHALNETRIVLISF